MKKGLVGYVKPGLDQTGVRDSKKAVARPIPLNYQVRHDFFSFFLPHFPGAPKSSKPNFRTDPGEIARVASRLGEANININYAYCGLEPDTNTPFVFFGIAEVSKTAPILEPAAAAAAKP